jgi:hypothetical protein
MATEPDLLHRHGQVFLSYAGADSVAAAQFAEVLSRNGVDVWFDKNSLQPGDRWMVTLEEAISRASAMVVYVGSLAGCGKRVFRCSKWPNVAFGSTQNQ